MKNDTRQPPSPPLASLVRKRRDDLGLTLGVVASRVKSGGAPCSTTALWGWERGLPIPERAWTPLARALRTSVKALRG